MGMFSDALRSEVGSYDDTEWRGRLGTHDVHLFAKPLTSADFSQVSRKHPDFMSNPTPEGMVDMLILKCRGENDVKAFDRGDKPVLMRVNTNVLGEIFAALFGTQLDEYTEDDLDADVKN